MKSGLLAATALSGLLLPAALWAHPLVDEGRRRFEMADFRGALEALDEAEAATDLDRADVIELLELRALVHHALDDGAGVERSLRALGALDPEHRFGREVPPHVVELFGSLERRPLRVDASWQGIAGGVAVTVAVEGAPPGLARHVVVRGRPAGGLEWSEAEDEDLGLAVEAGETVEWHAWVVGPGGATIATQGSEDAPERFVVPAGLGLDERPPESSGAPEPMSPWIWVGVAAGAAALVALVVTVAFVATAEPDTIIRRVEVAW